jgi:hypothetical protein
MADPDDDAVALARRVADELGNTLTPGPCCSPQATRLRYQIVNMLRCDACQDMSFRVANIHITGSIFRGVAAALEGPRHRIHIRIDPTLKDLLGKFERNTLVFPFEDLGTKDADIARNCETVIHECTHAGVALAGSRVYRTDNEVAGWFAGVLFLRAQGLAIEGTTDTKKNLRPLADDARKANVRGRIFDLPLAAIDALKRDITVAYKLSPGMVDEPMSP